MASNPFRFPRDLNIDDTTIRGVATGQIEYSRFELTAKLFIQQCIDKISIPIEEATEYTLRKAEDALQNLRLMRTILRRMTRIGDKNNNSEAYEDFLETFTKLDKEINPLANLVESLRKHVIETPQKIQMQSLELQQISLDVSKQTLQLAETANYLGEVSKEINEVTRDANVETRNLTKSIRRMTGGIIVLTIIMIIVAVMQLWLAWRQFN